MVQLTDGEGDRTARRRVAAAAALLVAWYAIAIAGPFLGDLAPAVDRLVNRGGHHAEGVIEWMEEIAWLAALVTFASLAIVSLRSRRVNPWLLALALWCFVAFGEEISWGQHLFHWHTPEAVKHVNFQGETNLHNVDVGVALGLPRSAARLLTKSAGALLTLTFTAGCAAWWILLPTLAERGHLRRWPRLAAIPVPRRGTRLLGVAGIAAYAVVDRFVDVGEILELILPLVALLSALDARDDLRAVAFEAREHLARVGASGTPSIDSVEPARRQA